MKSDTILSIVWMVYLTSQIRETENQTEDNYLFITPPHREWLSMSVNWSWVSSDGEEQKEMSGKHSRGDVWQNDAIGDLEEETGKLLNNIVRKGGWGITEGWGSVVPNHHPLLSILLDRRPIVFSDALLSTCTEEGL